MELQHLMYFKKTAELEHMTQASMELRIAQPALSKTIKSIEDELGVPLFERVNKRIHLNENGKILLDCANEIDALIHDLKEDLAGDSRRSCDVITILLKSAPIAIPSLIQKFNGENPHVNFRLLTWNRMLEEENVSYDFSISSSIQPIAGANSVPLFEEDMVLAVPENHPFAGRTISLQEACHEDFICLPAGTLYHHEFVQSCRDSGFFPHIVLESSDHYTILGLVEAEMGIAMIPRYSWGFHRYDTISFAHLREPALKNTTWLSWPKNVPLSDTHRKFKRFAMHELAGLISP